jgi:hypothetical protein
VATGSMLVPRDSATASLLPNGKVLIVGGVWVGSTKLNVATYYASAELYDPATRKFTPTGSLPSPATYDVATLLRDGRVLLALGAACKDALHCTNVSMTTGIEPLLKAELYDQASGKFTQTGSLSTNRLYATATLLSDGRVLIAGGEPYAELYDPGTGKFVRTGKASAIDGNITATLLASGKVLVTGEDSGGHFLAQLYDENTGKFTTVSFPLPPGTATYESKPIDRYVPGTATLLKDGRVLLFENGYLETYDPTTGACADAGFISPAGDWEGPTTTLLRDGRVLFEGGVLNDPVSGAGPNTNAAVVYDPTGGSIVRGSTLVARDYQTATLLPDGSVLIAGGEDSDGNVLTSAELFKP